MLFAFQINVILNDYGFGSYIIQIIVKPEFIIITVDNDLDGIEDLIDRSFEKSVSLLLIPWRNMKLTGTGEPTRKNPVKSERFASARRSFIISSPYNSGRLDAITAV